MEIYSIYGNRVKDETTVILSLEHFKSLKETVELEFRSPFDKNQLKWRLQVDPKRNLEGTDHLFLSLLNPKDTKNNVHARLGCVIVDGEGNHASAQKRFQSSKNYATFSFGGGCGFYSIERAKVEQLLVGRDGSLLVKCMVGIAKQIKADVHNLIPIGSGIEVKCAIKNFLTCGELTIGTIVTPFDEKVLWTLEVDPRDVTKKGEGLVSIWLSRANEENKEKVSITLSVLDGYGQVLFDRISKDWIDFGQLDVGRGFGWHQFISRKSIQELLVEGTLHLRIKIEPRDPAEM